MDLARAVAIVLVLVCHFGVFALRVPQPAQGAFYAMGFLGVELFFVLSGFLIGRIFLEMLERGGGLSFGLVGHFWLRRWLRTAPNYFLFLGLHALGGHAHLGIAYLFFGQNLFWPLTGSYPISWSLAVEEWFYLILPLAALAVFQVNRRALRAVLIAVALIFALSFGAKLLLGPGRIWEPEVRKVVAFRLDSLMFGVLLAAVHLYRRRWFRWLGSGPAMILNAVNLTALAAVSSRTYVSLEFAATPANVFLFLWADVTCALALAGLWSWRPGAFPFRRAVTMTSLLAYSLYLCHGPVMRVLLRTPVRPTGPEDPWGLVKLFAMTLASFLVAAGVYRFFEKPIMDLRQRLPKWQPA